MKNRHGIVYDDNKIWNIGYVSGSFDMFHVGHLNLLKRAKEHCNYLIVGVLDDDCIIRGKKHPPVIPLEDRLEIVKAIKYVDETDVTTKPLLNKTVAWEKYHFDAMFTGDDHASDGWAWDGPELEKLGAELVFFPYTEKVSSTKLRKDLNKEFNKMNINEMEISRNIYNHLADEESRYIFRSRIEYLFTGNRKCIESMTEFCNKTFHPAIIIKSFEYCPTLLDNTNILYGGGRLCSDIINQIRKLGAKVDFICDTYADRRFPSGEHLGIPVINRKELISKHSNANVIITTAYHTDEIADRLVNIFRDRLYTVSGHSYTTSNYIYQTSYFDVMPKSELEGVYIDCGVLDGDTIKGFIKYCNGNYKKIIGFEPQLNSYNNSLENIKDIKNVELINKGVYSLEGNLSFVNSIIGDGISGARIIDENFGLPADVIVPVVCIDKICDNLTDPVTFIKMDIEGSELEALKGAKNTILKDKPKLAICIYHKPEDIIEIPNFLYSLLPEKTFLIRHHNYSMQGGDILVETVLYVF